MGLQQGSRLLPTIPAHRDPLNAPAPGVRAQRRSGAGNPAALSVRLTKEQYDQLSERTERAGIPISALAREVILASLGDADGDRVAAKLEEVLRRTLSPDLLAS
jgi:hypothetical protein